MSANKKRIWINGQLVEVTDEVYAAYTKGDRKMRYFENDLKTERFLLTKDGRLEQIIPSREDSLDRLIIGRRYRIPKLNILEYLELIDKSTA